MGEIMVFCLAMNIYFEARSEPIEGQFAVAEVTLRRAAHSSRTVCYEVFSDSQFSWTTQADKLVVVNNKSWQKALEVAKMAIAEPTDYSRGATHFHADYVKPRWAKLLCKTVKIGRHIFYRECH